MTVDAYKAQILKLLPLGKVWQGPLFTKFVQAFAEECYRVAARADVLTVEAIPATTDELLPDYERLLGLPFPGFTLSDDDDTRRADVVARIIAQGGASKAYFLTIAATRGHPDAWITDGIRPFHAGSLCGERLYGMAWLYVWTVHIPDTVLADELFEYLLRRYKPAHTVVLFEYADPLP